jgi:hypothetical protein
MDDYSDRPGCIQLGHVARRSECAGNRTLHLSTTRATALVMVVLIASMAVSRA